MSEQRQHPRSRTLKGAQIVFNNAACVIDCVVRNASDGGATLQIASLVGVPDHFLLRVSDAPVPRACHVVWRGADRIGVAFQ